MCGPTTTPGRAEPAGGQFYLAQLVNLEKMDHAYQHDNFLYIKDDASDTTMYINRGGCMFDPPVLFDV